MNNNLHFRPLWRDGYNLAPKLFFCYLSRFNLESVFLLFSDSMLVVIMFSIQMQKRTNVVFVAVMEQRVRRSSQLLTRELE